MERRTQVEYKFEPEGPELPGAIHTFQLVRAEDRETRRHAGERWHIDVSNCRREVIARGITRSALAALIADGADWLAYVEGGA